MLLFYMVTPLELTVLYVTDVFVLHDHSKGQYFHELQYSHMK